jgi:hypothetical protein
MKVIVLLILSMAVVVCEQQTLFAPHYTTYGGLKAANRNSSCLACTEGCTCYPQNSLRPAAGVNRLAPVNSSYAKAAAPRNDVFPGVNRSVPLAGSGGVSLSIGGTADPGGEGTFHGDLEPTPDPNMNSTAPSGLDRPVFGPLNDGCPPCDWELRNSDSGWEDAPELRY